MMLRWIIITLSCLVALSARAQPAPVTECVTTAVAGGTGDAITIPMLRCVPTTTLLILTVTHSNITATPTLTFPGGVAQPIVENTGAILIVGRLQAGARYLLTNNGFKWFVLTGQPTTASLVPPVTILDNKTAPITADGYTVESASQGGTLAQTIFNQAVMSGNSTLYQSYDAIRAVANAPANSTVNTITGVGAYTVNNTVPVGQRSQSVSLFGIGVCQVDHSSCWGLDTIVSDNPTPTNTGVTTATGKFMAALEGDLNITSPNTDGANLVIGGTALPSNVVLPVSGVALFKLGGSGTALYNIGYGAADACCATAINIGANATSGVNKAGMPINFNYRDSSGAYQVVTLAALGGSLAMGGTNGYGFQTVSGPHAGPNGLILGATNDPAANVTSQFVVQNYYDSGGILQDYAFRVDAGQVMSFASSAGPTVAKYQFNGNVNISHGLTSAGGAILSGTINIAGASGGAASKFVCVDSSNNVVISASAC